MSNISLLTVDEAVAPANKHYGADFVFPIEVDCSVNEAAQNDIYQLMRVPAGMLIQAVAIEQETLEGAACLGDIGDFTEEMAEVDADGWGNDLNLNSAVGWVNDAAAAYKLAGGKVYTADSILGLTMVSAGGADTAKFKVWVYGKYPRA